MLPPALPRPRLKSQPVSLCSLNSRMPFADHPFQPQPSRMPYALQHLRGPAMQILPVSLGDLPLGCMTDAAHDTGFTALGSSALQNCRFADFCSAFSNLGRSPPSWTADVPSPCRHKPLAEFRFRIQALSLGGSELVTVVVWMRMEMISPFASPVSC